MLLSPDVRKGMWMMTASVLMASLMSMDSVPISARSPQSDRPFGQEPILEPRLVAEGIISTEGTEAQCALSPDGKSFYFTKFIPGFYGFIVVSDYKSGHWSEPRMVEFAGANHDTSPFISPDGQKLFFNAERPTRGGHFDIWVSERTPTGWSEPKNLGHPVNTAGAEFRPAVTTDGTLYFTYAAAGEEQLDIYRSRFVNGKYEQPEKLPEEINAKGYSSFKPYIAPDESFLVFNSRDRPDGHGGLDLYISYNHGGKWTPAKNLGPKVNTAAREADPHVSADGKYLFFSSDRGVLGPPRVKTIGKKLTYRDVLRISRSAGQNGQMDLYVIEFSALGLRP